MLRLIVNGKVAARPALRAAVEAVRGAGHRVEVRVTWEGGDAAFFAEEAVRAGVPRVVAAGGDGTLSEVVQGVMRAGPAGCAVGVVPQGTANDFATACGLDAANPEAALRLAAEGTARPIDVGHVSVDEAPEDAPGRRTFINVASGGFGAQVTAETPAAQKQLLGRAAYLISGLRHMTTLQARRLHLTGDDFTWEGTAFVFAVGNGRQAGGGFQVCPRACLDDGLLDVFVLPEMPAGQLLATLAELLRGLPPADTGAVYARVPALAVHSPDDLLVNLDGEPLRSRSYRFGLAPRVLPFVLPPEAPLAAALSS
ncbi:lipid kinase YegS [Rhodocaloribacter litoris]|nr:lipid kinase YegS [Rhodocaloribacter litoris]QXD13766.1 lipid kinase YegS [Rhodocaloribacter litoris]